MTESGALENLSLHTGEHRESFSVSPPSSESMHRESEEGIFFSFDKLQVESIQFEKNLVVKLESTTESTTKLLDE